MTRLEWDEHKRLGNVRKHGLDFENADWVLQNPFRMDIDSLRGDELRTQSFAYVFDQLAVLTLVHVSQDEVSRIISFRRASRQERESYHEWLAQE
jgi:uncharacterized protein